MTTTEMKTYLLLNQQHLATHVAIYGRVIESTATEIKVLCVGETNTITISKDVIKNRFASGNTTAEQLFLIQSSAIDSSNDEQSKVSCSKKISQVETAGSEIVFKDVIVK